MQHAQCADCGLQATCSFTWRCVVGNGGSSSLSEDDSTRSRTNFQQAQSAAAQLANAWRKQQCFVVKKSYGRAFFCQTPVNTPCFSLCRTKTSMRTLVVVNVVVKTPCTSHVRPRGRPADRDKLLISRSYVRGNLMGMSLMGWCGVMLPLSKALKAESE